MQKLKINWIGNTELLTSEEPQKSSWLYLLYDTVPPQRETVGVSYDT